MINFKTYTPLILTGLVKSFWYMEVLTDDDVYQEPILPDGHHKIIFYLDGKKSRREYSTGEWLNPRRLWQGKL